MATSKMDKIFQAISRSRCCVCLSPLSVPPIMRFGTYGEHYVCGRCEMINPQKSSTYSLLIYEDIVRHLSFPCRYRGCSRKIPWDEVEEHEGRCLHRTFCCPLFDSGCSRVLKVNDLRQHFMDTHPSCVKKVGTEIEVPDQPSSMFLLMMRDEPFIVYFLSGHRIALFSTNIYRYTQFCVKMMLSGNDSFSAVFKKQTIKFYRENCHCYMCVRGICQQLDHPFSKINKQRPPMNLDSFTTKLENPHFKLSAKHNKKLRLIVTPIPSPIIIPEHLLASMEEAEEAEQAKIEEVQREAQKEENSGDAQAVVKIKPRDINMRALRNSLTCPCCHIYMTATIYICEVGHSLCAECTMRLRTCPLCRASLRDGRNYILEELVAQVALPCVYDDKGCTFSGKPPVVRQHEAECPLRMQE